MRTVAFIAMVIVTGCASDDGELDELRTAVVVDCGDVQNGPSPTCSSTADAPIQCFLTALQTCTRARLAISQTFDDSGNRVELYTVPSDTGCDVITWYQNSDGFPPEGTSGREEVVSRCNAAAQATTSDGCAIVEASDCVVVSTNN